MPRASASKTLHSSKRKKPARGDSVAYKHILIPTDGSELARKAITSGIALAKGLGAKVTGITVTAPFSLFMDPYMLTDTSKRYGKRTAEVAKKYLGRIKDAAAAAGVSCNVDHVEHAQPYQAISMRRKRMAAT